MIKPTLNISTPSANYPIYIDNQLLDKPALLNQSIHSTQVFIITDSSIAPHYLPKLTSKLQANQVDYIILPPGEDQKSLATFAKITDHLIKNNHHRDTTLIALGGGVIGDITGFVAACYLRGVRYIQIPTTLLAQVDSSIGGKTAINHQSGKNLIGAFHHPNAVIIDTTTLNTLPDREYRAAFAEIIKAGLIYDATFFDWLEENATQLLAKDHATIRYAIIRACQIKAHFVENDEKEQNLRMHLNLGHTFGHAIEQCLGYGNWLHGEAVAYGMMLAAKLSQQHCGLSEIAYNRIEKLLGIFTILKKLPKNTDISHLTAAMQRDKKIMRNRLQLILLSDIGQSIITDFVTNDEILWLFRNGVVF